MTENVLSSKDDEKKSFRETFKMETTIIKAAIKQYGTEILEEERLIDMISAIVGNKLRHVFSNIQQNQKHQEIEGKSGFGFLNILFVISVMITIYSFLRPQQQQAQQGNGLKFDKLPNGSISVGPFEFKNGNELKFEKYCGKGKIYDLMYDIITRYVDDSINSTKDVMDDWNAHLKINFLLEGPPGTGKTIFVHYLATQLDRFLKLKVLAEENSEMHKKIIADSSAKEQYLLTAASKVYFCEVSPGAINSKWHGESEKNIHLLFEAAKKISEHKWVTVFLFFDEGDAFFSARNTDGGSNEITTGLKSELLGRIGVRPSDKYIRVVPICATNRLSSFDPGFLRRFGTREHFGLPNMEERKEFVKFVFRDFDLTAKEIEMVAKLTEGRSQSFITKFAKDYIKPSKTSDCSTCLELREFLKFLNDNKGDMNLA